MPLGDAIAPFYFLSVIIVYSDVYFYMREKAGLQ
jgi:hypothetical protein